MVNDLSDPRKLNSTYTGGWRGDRIYYRIPRRFRNCPWHIVLEVGLKGKEKKEWWSKVCLSSR